VKLFNQHHMINLFL